MRIDCIGGGSIGMLLAGRLAAGRAQVNLVTRTAEQAAALRSEGITVTDYESGVSVSSSIQAVDFGEYAEQDGAAPEWILLAVKQKDIDGRMLEAIRRKASPDTWVVCFQNGIGHMEKLRGTAAASHLLAAVTTEGARRKGLTEVWHTGRGYIRIGRAYPDGGGGLGGYPEDVLKIMREAGFDAESSNFIHREIWNKLIMNVVINPLTALLEVPNGGLLETGESLELMKRLYEEALGLAGELGIAVDEELWDKLLGVCRATARNRSSMLQDVEAGRQTELEWLTGSIIREGRRLGRELPAHETVYSLMKAKEHKARAAQAGLRLHAIPSAGCDCGGES